MVAVVGCSLEWASDLNRLREMFASPVIVAVGLDCPYREKVDYFATYHIEDINAYFEKRCKEKLNLDYKVITHTDDFIKYEKGTRKKVKKEKTIIDIIYPYEPPSGSSSLLATKAMIKQGFDKIVLCGCPLEGTNKDNLSYTQFQRGWMKHRVSLGDKVRSMSGWTKEFLGEPTKEWVEA